MNQPFDEWISELKELFKKTLDMEITDTETYRTEFYDEGNTPEEVVEMEIDAMRGG